MKTKSIFAALTLSLLLALPAIATPTHYDVDSGSVSGNNNGSGLTIRTAIVLTLPLTFDLDDGDSFSFNFFDIWTPEKDVGPDDEIPQSISATLQFNDPVTGTTIDGVTLGASLFFGVFEWGRVEWDGPVIVDAGDRVFSFDLGDKTFNLGLFGLHQGRGHGATITATITQLSSASLHQIPDNGGTAMLLGLSLVGVALAGRFFAGRHGSPAT